MANGLMTNTELMDTMLTDLNNGVKALLAGQYIAACDAVTQIAQKLVALRTAVDSDIKSRDQCIEDLKKQLRACGHEVVECECGRGD